MDRLKALPWALALQAGFVIGRRWRSLSAKDRERLARIVRESRGRPGNLRAKERKELRRLLGKLDPKAIGGELLALAGARKRRRKRR